MSYNEQDQEVDFMASVRERKEMIKSEAKRIGAEELFSRLNPKHLHEDLACEGARHSVIALMLAFDELGKLEAKLGDRSLLSVLWGADSELKTESEVKLSALIHFLSSARRQLVAFHEPSDEAVEEAEARVDGGEVS